MSASHNHHYSPKLTRHPTDVYYLAFPNDRRWPKAIVLGVFVIEVLQTVLATRDAFRNFATGWGNIEDLEEVGWLWFSVPVLGAISKSDYRRDTPISGLNNRMA